MKKILLLIILLSIVLLNLKILHANEAKSPAISYYNKFIELIADVNESDSEVTKSKLYPKILNIFFVLINNYPDDQWTYATFLKLASPINSYKFDKHTNFKNIQKNTKHFKFKNKYSTFIFYHVSVLMAHGSGYENYNDEMLNKLFKKCSNKKYYPYLNYLVRSDNRTTIEYRLELINEILNKYKDHLSYVEALRDKCGILFSQNKLHEALELLIKMTSEEFYNDKKWKNAYFIKNGLYEDAFLAIIGGYIALKNIDKANVYLKIAEEKFHYNYDLKYYKEKFVSLKNNENKDDNN